jgi:hypothetical protein
MNRHFLPAALLASCGLLCASPAGAATISLIPAAADVRPGDAVTIDVVIAGLVDGAAPSLGDFDIDIAFDAAALGFVSYTLGTELGGPGEALDVSFGFFPPGGVNIAQVSLLTVSELDLNQSDTFVLATLAFDVLALAPGETTSIDITGVYALGDADGNPIPLDGTSGTILTGVPAAIPLPGALCLLASALALFLRGKGQSRSV